MEYMESRIQDQIEAGFEHENELQKQFSLFRDWYLSIPDADETLVDWGLLDDRYNLLSPVDIVSAMWQGWKAARRV
ncbi:MAG: hypothetical protein GY920_12145 [Aliivibrio sp.]|nr:hypothetical protein [Aliivibrio sp.]